ncbi:MAG: IS21 family transposase [Pseudomonadota bacterium]
MKRAEQAGLSWPLPEGWSEASLEQRLFPSAAEATRRGLAQPDWPAVHRSLKRKGITLAFVWEDYRAAHPHDGYGYSRFCELYRRWEGRLSPTMRQHHFAGERAFVDYAGNTLEVTDGTTGEVRQALRQGPRTNGGQWLSFVGVLGASNYTFVEASWTQGLPDWIGAHVRMLEFFGGAPGQLVSDNLKAGVTKACFYEPKVNRTYADLAAHYDTAILPARRYRPRDKAKVEVGVQLVQCWIVARLRRRQFFSLAELNTAIGELLEAFNGKVTRHLGASRRQPFETLDRPALKALPAAPYEYAEWVERKVGLDYHVEVGKHYYSVPHTLLRQKLWARVTARTVEIFHNGEPVAAHVRTSGNRQHTTVPEHIPARSAARQRGSDRTPASSST